MTWFSTHYINKQQEQWQQLQQQQKQQEQQQGFFAAVLCFNMAARARFQGGPADLAAALRPFVQQHGKSWLRYCEAEQVKKAKLDAEACVKYGEIAAACRQLQGNMSFTKTVVEKCMKELAEQFCGKWGMTGQEATDWQGTMVKRLRNMLANIAQAENRDPKPEWLQRMPWHAGEDGAGEGEAHSDAEEEEEEGSREGDVEYAKADGRWTKEGKRSTTMAGPASSSWHGECRRPRPRRRPTRSCRRCQRSGTMLQSGSPSRRPGPMATSGRFPW